jgi:hypothetical protein
MGHLAAKSTGLEQYVNLIGLSDRNETLFYRTVMSNPARFIPIIYDLTVTDAFPTALKAEADPCGRGIQWRRPKAVFCHCTLTGTLSIWSVSSHIRIAAASNCGQGLE